MSQKNTQQSIRRTVLVLALLAVGILGMVIARQVLLVPEAAEAPPVPELSALNTFVYDEGRPLASFQLTNEQGQSVSNAALQGHWTFAFVGYTYCPDICPTTLATLRQVAQALPADVPAPEFLLISADPDRDTPMRLAEYLDFFGDRFHGLTGDIESLRALARTLNAAFSRRTDEDGNVLVDHSAHVALINPEGEMIAVIQPPLQSGKIAKAYEQIYAWAKRTRDAGAS